MTQQQPLLDVGLGLHPWGQRGVPAGASAGFPCQDPGIARSWVAQGPACRWACPAARPVLPSSENPGLMGPVADIRQDRPWRLGSVGLRLPMEELDYALFSGVSGETPKLGCSTENK